MFSKGTIKRMDIRRLVVTQHGPHGERLACLLENQNHHQEAVAQPMIGVKTFHPVQVSGVRLKNRQWQCRRSLDFVVVVVEEIVYSS
jgi:hypothetical protein